LVDGGTDGRRKVQQNAHDHVFRHASLCMSYEEEDTRMPYEEEDTRMSYEEEDTRMSYEEDTCS
jgi:hypothetical protein